MFKVKNKLSLMFVLLFIIINFILIVFLYYCELLCVIISSFVGR
jgi:hypothetical protein